MGDLSDTQLAELRQRQNSPYREIYERTAEFLMGEVEFYSLPSLPDHIRKKLDKILVSTSGAEADDWAYKSKDSMFLHKLVHGKAKNKKYYTGLAQQEDSRARSYRDRGWDKAAEEHELKAKELWALASAAPDRD